MSFGIAFEVTSEKSAKNGVDVFHFSVFYWVILKQFQHLVRVNRFLVNVCKNTIKSNEISIFQVNVELQLTKLTMFKVVLLGTFVVAAFILLLLVNSI